VNACFASASVTNRLLVMFFLRSPNRWKSLHPRPSAGIGVVAALMSGGCGPFHCILHAVLWTYLRVLVFSNRLHFVHTSSQVCFVSIRWGCREQDTDCVISFPRNLASRHRSCMM
jgi:hypothetical protein